MNATWVITRGVMLLLAGDEVADNAAGLAVERVAALRAALARFSEWDAGNDSYGEHDFGAFDLFGERLFFKIDYYDKTLTCHSPDATDKSVTERVITVMLAEEY